MLNDAPFRILVIDDDREICDFVRIVGEGLGSRVCTATNGKEVRAALLVQVPDLICLDIIMPDEDGVELVGYLREQSFPNQLLLMSRNREYLDSTALLARGYGIRCLEPLAKPFGEAKVAETIARAMAEKASAAA